jgi:alginate O-acetyltransferase complex protein AlgI
LLFSSLLFLWLFLPLVLLVYLPLPQRGRNAWLLLASLVFYAWGGVSYSAVLWASIGINYACGRALARNPQRWVLALGVGGNLSLLAIFKYANFFTENINELLRWQSIPPFELPRIALPLGISFYTFQAISYLVDVYRGTTPGQRSLPRLALFISLFPQLIAGPIVRYHVIAEQLKQRTVGWADLAIGLRRFLIGLAKKVLLANNFALLADEIFNLDPATMSPATAWAGAGLYALQIFFDFSGYSDMAIGLGRLFGFRIPENFNYPYISRSIREFWRRWHITLSEWFRDYLYIPLGGNRGGRRATYRNLLIVFLLTGLWHGAAWHFLIWGLWHGFFMVLERQRWFPRLPVAVAHGYALLVVLLGWVLFNADDITHATGYLVAMFGGNAEITVFDWAFYWDRKLTLASIVGLLACTPVFARTGEWLEQWSAASRLRAEGWGSAQALGLLVLFLLCTLELVTHSYNPFIYFRF